VTPVSWFFVGLGVISAAVVLLQIITRGRHQRKQDLAMNVVWPVAALFLGPVAIWAYDRWGTTNPGRPNSGPSDDQEAAQTIAGSAPGEQQQLSVTSLACHSWSLAASPLPAPTSGYSSSSSPP
jgi:hypothetical protein